MSVRFRRAIFAPRNIGGVVKFENRRTVLLLLAAGCGSDGSTKDREQGCLVDECGPGQYCELGGPETAPVCRELLGAGDPCADDAQCNEPLICETACVDPMTACTVGTATCTEGGIERCTGRGFTVERHACGEGTVCVQLSSVGVVCKDLICTPEERRCADAHTAATCDGQGVEEAIVACDATQLCGDGACADTVVEDAEKDGILGGLSRMARDGHVTVLDVTEDRLLRGFGMDIAIDEPIHLGWVVYEDKTPSDAGPVFDRIFYTETTDSSGASDMALPLLKGHRYALGVVPLGETTWAAWSENAPEVALTFGRLIGSVNFVGGGSPAPAQLDESLDDTIWKVTFRVAALP